MASTLVCAVPRHVWVCPSSPLALSQVPVDIMTFIIGYTSTCEKVFFHLLIIPVRVFLGFFLLLPHVSFLKQGNLPQVLQKKKCDIIYKL